MPETILITGANRGIGLALTKVFLSQGHKLFAACRQPSQAGELENLQKQYPGHLMPVELAADSDSSAAAAASAVSRQTGSLDLLFNNAGISPAPYDAGLEKVDFQKCREAFEVNALGPLRVARAFLLLLRKSKNPRILNITSGLASLSGKAEGNFYAYGASKAALNMLTRTMAFELKKDGITVVCLDPGWVQTDMGGAGAPLKPEESATAIARTALSLTLPKTSLFLYNDGNELKW